MQKGTDKTKSDQKFGQKLSKSKIEEKILCQTKELCMIHIFLAENFYISVALHSVDPSDMELMQVKWLFAKAKTVLELHTSSTKKSWVS